LLFILSISKILSTYFNTNFSFRQIPIYKNEKMAPIAFWTNINKYTH